MVYDHDLPEQGDAAIYSSFVADYQSAGGKHPASDHDNVTARRDVEGRSQYYDHPSPVGAMYPFNWLTKHLKYVAVTAMAAEALQENEHTISSLSPASMVRSLY